ncbi:MAG: histidine phosphatase family protein [Actinomycetota bacterium]
MDDATSGATTELLVIRHGQSTWNQEKRWQGQADPPLSDHGRQQAFIAAQSVGQVDVIVSSPQARAAQTAGIIAEQIGVGPVQLLDGLEERGAGEWSGLTREEIDTRWPGWVDSENRPNGWEYDDVFVPRVMGAITRVADEFAGATALVVCHGGVIIAIERELGVSDGRIPNLHGRVVRRVGDELVGGDRLELIPTEMRTGGTGRDTRRI